MRGDLESRSVGRAARPLPRTARPGPRAPESPSRWRGAPRRPDREGRRGAGREAGRGPHADAPSPRPLAATWRARLGCRAPSAQGGTRLGPAAAPNFPGDGTLAGAPQRGAAPQLSFPHGRRAGAAGARGLGPRRLPQGTAAHPGKPGVWAPRPAAGLKFPAAPLCGGRPSSRCPRSPPKSPGDETLSPDARWARFWKTPGPGEGARLVPARRQPRSHLCAGTRPGRPSPRPAAVRVLRRPSPRPGAGARLPTPCPAAPGRGAHWTRGEGTRRLGAAGAELAVAWRAGWRSPASDLWAPLIPAAADVRRVPEGPAPVFN